MSVFLSPPYGVSCFRLTVVQYCLSAICALILFVSCGQNQRILSVNDDSVSEIKGADKTIYSLYVEHKPNDREKSMKYAELFIERIDTAEKSRLIAEVCDTISKWYEMEQFKYSVAIAYKKRSLENYVALGENTSVAVCEYGLARMYIKKGMYGDALRCLDRAIAYFDTDSGCQDVLMECYKLMGVVYSISKDTKISDYYFQQYSSMARTNSDGSNLSVGLNNSAAFASGQGDTAKANVLLEESIRYGNENIPDRFLCKIYTNAALSCVFSKQYELASDYLEKAYPLMDNPELAGHWYMVYGTLLMDTEDAASAVVALEKSLEYYAIGEFEMSRLVVYELLTKVNAELGDTVKAYKYHNLMHEEYVRENEEIMKLIKVQEELELEKYSAESEKSGKKYIVSVISALFLAVCAIVFAFCYGRRAKYKLKSLENVYENLRMTYEEKLISESMADKVVHEIADELANLISDANNVMICRKLGKMRSRLLDYKSEEDLKEIKSYIPDSNTEFFKKLVEDFPNLTANESQLSILINKNLTTKQISNITHQSPESINVARSRLRKKFGISNTDMSIVEFLRRYN